MKWHDVGKTAAKLAPALGGALLGPGGAAIGALVAGVYGTDATPDAVAQAIAADPQAAVTLRGIELQHAEAITALMTADIQHAREQHGRSIMPAVVTVALTLMVIGAFAVLVLTEIPPGSREAAMLIVGQVIGAFAGAVAYWIGSSRGSALKQDAIERR